VTGVVALVLADISLRANPKAAGRLLDAHHFCRVVHLGQRLPRRKRTMAIPLVTEAVAAAIPAILTLD